MSNFLFKSDRLGFRNWREDDKSKLFQINSDPRVMEYFPRVVTEEQTSAFVNRMNVQFSETGFCYYAVDKLDTNELIGFIGISIKSFESEFTPCNDIGWRLSYSSWGKGYATEGAKKCLEFAFNDLRLTNIKSICPIINNRSEKVMVKIGMKKVKVFDHPELSNYKTLEKCVLYEIEK